MICGLQNLGNTCYFNCILQLLMRCESYINIIDIVSHKSIIMNEFKNFINRYRNENCIAPEEIKKIIKEKLKFNEFEQYDAHEFLILFLDIIEIEFKKSNKMNINDKFFNFKYDTFFKNMEDTNDVKKITTTETILSLPFHLDLQNAINSFKNIEKIENWESEKNRQFVNAEKYNDICYWPKYLFIQINRYDAQYQKINEKMTIPLNIDNYKFIGAVVHYGLSQFGHYISILKINEKYFLCDDDKIKIINENEAINFIERSYLLLYEK